MRIIAFGLLLVFLLLFLYFLYRKNDQTLDDEAGGMQMSILSNEIEEETAVVTKSRSYEERKLPIEAVESAVFEVEEYLAIFEKKLDADQYQRIFKNLFLIKNEVFRKQSSDDLLIKELLRDIGTVFEDLAVTERSNRVRAIIYYLLLIPEESFH